MALVSCRMDAARNGLWAVGWMQHATADVAWMQYQMALAELSECPPQCFNWTPSERHDPFQLIVERCR